MAETPAEQQSQVIESPAPPASAGQLNPPGEVLPSDSIECRLMVNFISTGGGINGQARLELERYQMRFADEEKLPVQPRRLPRGREGEVEYCYPMYGYDEAQRARFIQGLRDLMKDQPLVIINENRKQALY